MKILRIKGVEQNYAWGGKEYIPELLNKSESNETVAEYWMGAHDRGPSYIPVMDKPLNSFISEKPIEILGTEVYEKFGRLPYLFKVLDVNDMLSIQVHPSKKEAEKGFALENLKGVDINAPFRNYKDDNHKPEIMVALSEFWLLHGFRSEINLKSILQEVPEFNHLIEIFEVGSYRGLYEYVMLEQDSETNRILGELIKRLKSAGSRWNRSQPEYWALKAYDLFCKEGKMDKGIYSIFFFNLVKVNKGEAIFQDAGIPHAYLEGQNIELMANSDNVLRAGLTPKHMDIEELLKHVKFEATIPNILKGESIHDGLEKVFSTPAPDFELSSLLLKNEEEYRSISKDLEIYVLIAGKVKVSSDEEEFTLSKGEVMAIPSNVTYTIKGLIEAKLYKARSGLFGHS